MFGPKSKKEVLDPFAGQRVERSERLVHEQDRRRRGKGACDGYAALHPRREFSRKTRLHLSQTEVFEDCSGVFAPILPAQQEAKIGVLPNGLPGKKTGIL